MVGRAIRVDGSQGDIPRTFCHVSVLISYPCVDSKRSTIELEFGGPVTMHYLLRALSRWRRGLVLAFDVRHGCVVGNMPISLQHNFVSHLKKQV